VVAAGRVVIVTVVSVADGTDKVASAEHPDTFNDGVEISYPAKVEISVTAVQFEKLSERKLGMAGDSELLYRLTNCNAVHPVIETFP
jgi:hypothetical protein